MDPDVAAVEVVAVQLLLGPLGLVGREKLDQAPVLDDAVFYCNLQRI